MTRDPRGFRPRAAHRRTPALGQDLIIDQEQAIGGHPSTNMRSRSAEGRGCLDGWKTLALQEQESFDTVISYSNLTKHDDSTILRDILPLVRNNSVPLRKAMSLHRSEKLKI